MIFPYVTRLRGGRLGFEPGPGPFLFTTVNTTFSPSRFANTHPSHVVGSGPSVATVRRTKETPRELARATLVGSGSRSLKTAPNGFLATDGRGRMTTPSRCPPHAARSAKEATVQASAAVALLSW
jgi:hypothetical protein